VNTEFDIEIEWKKETYWRKFLRKLKERPRSFCSNIDKTKLYSSIDTVSQNIKQQIINAYKMRAYLFSLCDGDPFPVHREQRRILKIIKLSRTLLIKLLSKHVHFMCYITRVAYPDMHFIRFLWFGGSWSESGCTTLT